MRIYGYKNGKQVKNVNPYDLKEATIACSLEELHDIMSFVVAAYKELKDYSFPYGECTIQFRDRSKTWKAGDPDFVLAIRKS